MGWARGEGDEGRELELEGGDLFGEGGVVGAGQGSHFYFLFCFWVGGCWWVWILLEAEDGLLAVGFAKMALVAKRNFWIVRNGLRSS